MHPVMHYVQAFNFSIDVCPCSWGCLPVCIGVGRVLFAGRRDGDATPLISDVVLGSIKILEESIKKISTQFLTSYKN